MNKFSKILVVIMLVIIAGYIIFAAFFDGGINNDINGDEIISGDMASGEDIEVETYRVEKVDENQIAIIANAGESQIITNYVFENDALKTVYMVQDVVSGDYAEGILEALKADENISQIYSEIRLEGTQIIMILKDEYREVYADITYEELYEDLKKSLNIE